MRGLQAPNLLLFRGHSHVALEPVRPMFQAILLDVDGTLANTDVVHRRAFPSACAERGMNVDWSALEYRELLKVTGGAFRAPDPRLAPRRSHCDRGFASGYCRRTRCRHCRGGDTWPIHRRRRFSPGRLRAGAPGRPGPALGCRCAGLCPALGANFRSAAPSRCVGNHAPD